MTLPKEYTKHIHRITGRDTQPTLANYDEATKICFIGHENYFSIWSNTNGDTLRLYPQISKVAKRLSHWNNGRRVIGHELKDLIAKRHKFENYQDALLKAKPGEFEHLNTAIKEAWSQNCNYRKSKIESNTCTPSPAPVNSHLTLLCDYFAQQFSCANYYTLSFLAETGKLGMDKTLTLVNNLIEDSIDKAARAYGFKNYDHFKKSFQYRSKHPIINAVYTQALTWSKAENSTYQSRPDNQRSLSPVNSGILGNHEIIRGGFTVNENVRYFQKTGDSEKPTESNGERRWMPLEDFSNIIDPEIYKELNGRNPEGKLQVHDEIIIELNEANKINFDALKKFAIQPYKARAAYSDRPHPVKATFDFINWPVDAPPYDSPEGWEYEKALAVRRIKLQSLIDWDKEQGTPQHLIIAERLTEILTTL